MSYISGFMLGASIGNGLHEFFTNKQQGRGGVAGKIGGRWFVLLHAISGRRRYQVAKLQGNPALAELLEEKLCQLRFMDSVQANPLTGSLLCFYHGSEKVMDDLTEVLKKILANTTKKRYVPDGLAETMKVLRCTTENFNHWVKCQSGNWFDLSSLLSVFFLFRGLRKMLLWGQRPSGPQMIWWAVSLLRGWRMS